MGTGSARAFGALGSASQAVRGPASPRASASRSARPRPRRPGIVVEFGVDIAELGRSIQRNVKQAVERMTGLQVVEVNVAVDDVYLPTPDDQDADAPSRVSSARRHRTGPRGAPPAAVLVDGVDVEAVAMAVAECPGVSGLDSGRYGEVASYLPGRPGAWRHPSTSEAVLVQGPLPVGPAGCGPAQPDHRSGDADNQGVPGPGGRR